MAGKKISAFDGGEIDRIQYAISDGAPQKITILLTDSGKKTSAELVKRLRNTAAPTRNDQRIVVVVARGYPTRTPTV